MTQEFMNKVIRMGIVDTKKYRYVTKHCEDGRTQWVEIRRIPLSYLDTVAALDEWETVARID